MFDQRYSAAILFGNLLKSKLALDESFCCSSNDGAHSIVFYTAIYVLQASITRPIVRLIGFLLHNVH